MNEQHIEKIIEELKSKEKDCESFSKNISKERWMIYFSIMKELHGLLNLLYRYLNKKNNYFPIV